MAPPDVRPRAAADLPDLLRAALAAHGTGDARGTRAALDAALEAIRVLRAATEDEPRSEGTARVLALCDYFTGEIRALSRSPSSERLGTLARVAAMYRSASRF